MFTAIHNPGQRPYLYNNSSNQPVAVNQAIINNVDVSGVLPVGLVGDKHALNPQTSRYQCSEGIGYNTAKYDAWIVDGEYFYNRLSNPTGSDSSMFSNVRQQQYEDKHKRQPILIPNDNHNRGNIHTSTIRNTNDKAERIVNKNVATSVANPNEVENMFKQKRKRFANIDNDYESKLPIFMRNSRLNFVDLNDKSPIDEHTDKLIENSKNKLLNEDRLDENTRWNKNEEYLDMNPQGNALEWTTTHNPQSEKAKDNNTFKDGISLPRDSQQKETFLSSTPGYYSANERREYFNNKLRTNAGNYVSTLMSNNKEALLNTLDNANSQEHLDTNGFITDFDFNQPELANGLQPSEPQYIDMDGTTDGDYFMVNDSEYIYINHPGEQQGEQTERYTLIGSTNDTFNGFDYEANNRETFNNITTGRLLYKNVLQSYSIMLVNYLLTFDDFKPWLQYWRYLHKNLYKCNCTFEILKPNDKDVAYVQNKGEKMRFRIQDCKRFVPISVYTYVLCHELAHLANEHEYGHAQNFQDLMHLIELAAYELGIIKPEKYPYNNYMSNDMVILSKGSIKQELIEGINLVVAKGANRKFYTDLANKIYSL